ncbi:PstS family phosphate ABC transporter substrate-binding protein [Pseudogracilibacillus auburnensis]|uniref:Phosphate-binding protein n=1 Tax=Pseudogracilibacillus auburnensis TaxID=1494959 RepID=A0A2V3W223_9BACI|nr:PstS family phosphate ABC transporter substrate-binding protein [Pseudogracilibacillus auburnensis]MBO1002308.1 PstS family phosphate ABC transporter substrate-binding protein [Pseudogracilibacillus auburnensis]PXW86305.1 phosphate ABC transporter substrate-binding protein (PhoT family) [Pseudogracilibacillus auburnensis]
MKFKNSWKLFLVGILAIILIACQNSNEEETGKEEDTESPEETEVANEEASDEAADLEGSVVIDGSGTVYPLMAKLAEEYMTNEQEGVSVEVSRAGTSAGFEKFLVENGTDFNDASRQIKNEEAEKAEELGIEVKELKVALDGLTFVINKENDWATEMTEEELTKIFLADGGMTNWSDINPDWPDEKINTYGPNENHGTYEFFFENVLEEQDLVDDVDLQQEYSTLVNLIADDENGIAFFGFGYYVNNEDKLQAVSVDFGDGAVEPSLNTIAEDGDYAAFTRPVFTYLNVNNAKEKPQVLDYAIYAMENINEFAGETGFAPIPSGEVQENLDFLFGLQ